MIEEQHDNPDDGDHYAADVYAGDTQVAEVLKDFTPDKRAYDPEYDIDEPILRLRGRERALLPLPSARAPSRCVLGNTRPSES
jgi:hypothetical protein